MEDNTTTNTTCDGNPEPTWAKIEIMGHDTFYGRVRSSPCLSGVRVDVLPPGESDGEKKETYPRDFAQEAIFSITPLPEEECRTLAANEFYDESPLDRSEQKRLVKNRIKRDAAESVLKEAGLEVFKHDVVEELGAKLAENVVELSAHADELDGDAAAHLREIADDNRRRLQRFAGVRANRLLQEAVGDDGD